MLFRMSWSTTLFEGVNRGHEAGAKGRQAFSTTHFQWRKKLTSRVQVTDEIDVELCHLFGELLFDGRELSKEQLQFRPMEHCTQITSAISPCMQNVQTESKAYLPEMDRCQG